MNNENNKIIGKSKFSDEVLNKLINEKIGYLSDLKKQFGYDQELIIKLALMNVAIKEFGQEIDDLFYNVLMKTEIFTTEGYIDDFEDKLNKIGVDVIPNTLGGYISNFDNYRFNGNFQKKDPIIIVAKRYFDKTSNNAEFFDTLFHELRHALTSEKNTFGTFKDGTKYIRSGLHIRFQHKNNMLRIGDLIDEAYNEHIAVCLTNGVLRYNNNSIDNIEVKKVLNSLNKDLKLDQGYFQTNAYGYGRYHLTPLLNNRNMTLFVDEVSYNGNIFDFYNLFPDFAEYSMNFENLVKDDINHDSSKEFKQREEEFATLTKQISKIKI